MRAGWLVVTLLFLAVSARAADQQVVDISVTSPWSRATALGAPNGVVYLGIVNHSGVSDRLAEVTSDAAARVQIHQSMDGMPGMMMMEPVKNGVPIPAGQTVTLKPGGLHIMLMGLKRQLKPGDTVPLSLTFDKAGKIDVLADVGAPGATKPPKPSRLPPE